MTKNVFSKTLSILITFAMLLALLPGGFITVSAATTESGKCGKNLTWTLNNGELYISGTGDMYDYGYSTVPWGKSFSKIRINSGVTSIGREAFKNCTNLTSVTIPGSVTSIGDSAFSGCTGLTSVYITDIAAWCAIDFINVGYASSDYTSNPLNYAHNLYLNGKLSNDLVIPDSVTSIGKHAFYGFTGLVNVTIPDSVTSIGENAFKKCTGLTSVTIGNSVTSIGSYAFRGCTGLKSITIPNSVTSIGQYAFYGLTSVTVAAGNPVYHSAGNCLIETESKTLIAGFNNSVIPTDGSVTSIGYGAFEACTGLTSVTIPDGVTSIGDCAFYRCTDLTSVTIPDSVTSIGAVAFKYCAGLTSVTMGNGVTSIGNCAFEDCTSLRSLTIPNSVTSIGDYAFYNCNLLTVFIYRNASIENYIIKNYIRYAYISPDRLSISQLPSKLTYLKDRETIDASGGKLLLTYENGHTTEIPIDNNMIGGFDNSKVGNQTIIIYCDGKTTSFDVEVIIKPAESISVATLPTKLTYLEGKDELDVTGGSLTLVYDDGYTIVVPMENDMVIGFDNTKLGIQTLTVVCDERVATFDVEIIAKSLLSILVTTLPDKISYTKDDEALDVTDGKITLYYNNDTSEEIDMTLDMVSGFDNTIVGQQTILVTYHGKTTTFEVEIAKSLTRIAVTQLPTKKAYLEGKETLSVTGGKLKLYYDNDTSEVVDMTLDMVSGFNNTIVGQQTILVTYYGKTTTFKVEIIAKSLTTIAVIEYPAKMVYLERKETLSVTGGKLKLYYDNDTSEIVDMTLDMVSGFDNTLVGTQRINVKYKGFISQFDITVISKDSFNRIEVVSVPIKTKYIEGKEELDVTGGRINLYYKYGIRDVVDMTLDMISGYDNKTVGKQTLTLTYNGCSDTFEIEIIKNKLFITNLPSKRSYIAGKETLNLNDGEIVFYYDDGSSETIRMTPSMINGFDNTKAGTQVLTVNYSGYFDTFEVILYYGKKGDCDHDNKITVADALAALRVAAKIAKADIRLLAFGDTDADGVITVADALVILRVAAKVNYCYNCGGKGKVNERNDLCLKCGGNGKIYLYSDEVCQTCWVCKGTGYRVTGTQQCSKCLGVGSLILMTCTCGNIWWLHNGGTRQCSKCGKWCTGTSYMCSECNGTGRVEIRSTCYNCHGNGETCEIKDYYSTCRECEGAGHFYKYDVCSICDGDGAFVRCY